MQSRLIVGIAGVAAMAGVASADLVATFGFTELNASFTVESGEFIAVADSNNGLATTGDVTNYNGGLSSALFDPGFFTGGTLANAEFRMNIASTDGTNASAVNGSILITDADGDVLFGTFVGDWQLRNGFAFFSGDIISAGFDGSAGNGAFDGPNGGSFTNPAGVLTGALSVLMFPLEAGLFEQNFSGVSASAQGMLVPAPGAIALLGLGGLAIARRRR